MISEIDYKKYLHISGWVFLGCILVSFIFILYLNSQDISKMNVKNSDRRKINEKYSDENMEKIKNGFKLYKNNVKRKENLKERYEEKKFKNKNSKINRIKNDLNKYRKNKKKKKNKK